MGQRNRDSISLSPKGIEVVRAAKSLRRLTQESWADCSVVSLSTVKRFLSGKRVDPSCFYALLNSLELEVQDSYIAKNNKFLEPLPKLKKEISTYNIRPLLFMTATFTQDKCPQIDIVLRHLEKLLIGSKIKFNQDKEGVLTIKGEFLEEKRVHIEETIKELEELCSSCEITW